MDQETKDRIRHALNDGHLDICCEVADVKNLLLACEHAAIYAEEQKNTLHEPPDWGRLFYSLGRCVGEIEKKADALFDLVMQAAGEDKSTNDAAKTA